jgi:hypothetical protein
VRLLVHQLCLLTLPDFFYRSIGKIDIPLLHLVETWKGWDGDKDDNSLLAVANFNLQSDQSQHASSMFLLDQRIKQWSAARPIPIPQLGVALNARRRRHPTHNNISIL